jgi:ADP-ribose pyrophosphatase
MPRWQKITTRTILNHPRMQLVEDDIILPDATKTSYLLEVNKGDYVTVIARTDGKIAMVYDYSYPHDSMLLQFPEGGINQGETPEQAAKRELEEETGLHAETVSVIGKNLDSSRRNTTTNFILFSDDVHDTGVTHLEAEESFTETVLLTESEILQKIASGEIVQKNALAAWAIYTAWQP